MQFGQTLPSVEVALGWEMTGLQQDKTQATDAGRRIAGALVACVGVLLAGTAAAVQPEPWGMMMQPGASPIRDRMDSFHTELLWIIAFITAFVLGLQLFVRLS